MGWISGCVTQLIERFGVILDRPIDDLSKGNRQKLGIVLAFMHPELLVLDEPSSGLDPLMRRAVGLGCATSSRKPA